MKKQTRGSAPRAMGVDLTTPQLRFSGLPACALGRVNVFGVKLRSSGTGPPMPDLRRWPRLALVYTVGGEAEYVDGHGLQATLVPGDLLIVFPGFPQSFYPRAGKIWSEVFLDFDGPLFEPWARSGVLDSRRPIYHLTPVPYWAQRIWAIQACAAHPSVEESLQRLALLTQLLAEIVASRASVQSSSDDRWLADARRALDARSLHTANVPAAARKLGLSYDHFRQKFTRLAGVPPQRYISRVVMERACELITSGVKSEVIASELGFSDAFHFSKRFREVIGIPPRAFRQLSQGIKSKRAGRPE